LVVVAAAVAAGQDLLQLVSLELERISFRVEKQRLLVKLGEVAAAAVVQVHRQKAAAVAADIPNSQQRLHQGIRSIIA
jgi:hypothetical protein